jgi:WhiB family transcriptional regulator, redox-sensing transcriptional regulator
VTVDWFDLAACRRHPQELWYPKQWKNGDREIYAAARAICATCPVAEECLEYCLALPSHIGNIGMWAGTTPEERKVIRRQREHAAGRQSNRPGHGTPKAWVRHLLADQAPCKTCREAHEEFERREGISG